MSAPGKKVDPRALLESVAEAVERCNRCGFCQAGCPTYKVTGVEWMTARGRIALASAAIDGRLPLEDLELSAPVWSCLGCDGCTMHCPPAIRTDEIMDAVREALVAKGGEPLIQRLITRGVLPHPIMLAAAAKGMSLAQSTGLMPFGAKLGGLVLGGQVGEAAEILPPMSGKTAREAIGKIEPLPNAKLRVAYFLGCATNLLWPDVGAATVRVLRRSGIDVVLPDTVCCGKPAQGYGDRSAARDLAAKNVDRLAALDVDYVVVDCPTCGSFLEKYPELLADDPARAERAANIAHKVKDVASLLAETGVASYAGEVKARVTYHDPCHLAHFHSVTKEPRALLAGVPGVEFVESAEADLCCGGAGTFGLRERELSLKVLDRKMAHFAATDADVIATACPSCMLQLSYGARRTGLNAEVLHVVQVIDRAQGEHDR